MTIFRSKKDGQLYKIYHNRPNSKNSYYTAHKLDERVNNLHCPCCGEEVKLEDFEVVAYR